jgi:hypothetical protein
VRVEVEGRLHILQGTGGRARFCESATAAHTHVMEASPRHIQPRLTV